MIKSFEGARGLAAVFVALYHFGVLFRAIPLIEYGYLFVDLFFVLSGFVISATYSSRITKFADLKPFMIRRFGRLFPLMVFTTILFVLAFNFAIWMKRTVVAMGYTNLFKNPEALNYMVPNVGELAGTVLFTQGMGVFDSLILNYASWSVSVEFYTYIVFALVWIMLRHRVRLFTSLLLSFVGITVAAWTSFTLHDCVRLQTCYSVTFDFGFARCIGGFFLGTLTYRLSKAIKINAATCQLAVLIAFTAFYCSVGRIPTLAFVFPLLCALLVASISHDEGFLADWLQRKPFQVLGERSYSIYLLHPIALAFFAPVTNVINASQTLLRYALCSIIGIVVYLMILIVVSGWTFKFIESPCRDWFNRIATRKASKTSSITTPIRSAS
jgi:peptidoglycan/LPS O-acetylase OafA/YrhL